MKVAAVHPSNVCNVCCPHYLANTAQWVSGQFKFSCDVYMNQFILESELTHTLATNLRAPPGDAAAFSATGVFTRVGLNFWKLHSPHSLPSGLLWAHPFQVNLIYCNRIHRSYITKGKGRGKRTTGHPENWSCYCTRHVSITVTENLHTHTSLFQHSQHFTEWTLDTICVDRHIHTQIQIAGISSWECRHTFVIQNSPVFISLGFLCLSALISRNEAERCHNGTIISWTSPCQVHLTAGIWTSTYFIFKNEK